MDVPYQDYTYLKKQTRPLEQAQPTRKKTVLSSHTVQPRLQVHGPEQEGAGRGTSLLPSGRTMPTYNQISGGVKQWEAGWRGWPTEDWLGLHFHVNPWETL